jgi:hypothetical protein
VTRATRGLPLAVMTPIIANEERVDENGEVFEIDRCL